MEWEVRGEGGRGEREGMGRGRLGGDRRGEWAGRERGMGA